MTETQLRLNAVKERALNEQPQTLEDLLAAADAPLADLIEAAHEVTAAKASSVFNFCAIVNAKSGRCSEDCHWCAQSKHYQGACSVYPLLDAKNVIDGALAAEKSGATRYSLVTSGRKLSPREVMMYTLDRETPAQGLQKVSVEQMRSIAEPLMRKGIKVQIRG